MVVHQRWNSVIKRATAGDVPALMPLIASYWSFEEIDGFDAARVEGPLARLLSDPSLGAAWIAFEGSEAVGYLVGVYVMSLEHMGLTAEIDELFVAASERGKGTGATLLEAAEREFARVGCTNVSLELARGNDRAREFYRRRGYCERAKYERIDKML
jgi:GNAT superfamily N-acetyltransferase